VGRVVENAALIFRLTLLTKCKTETFFQSKQSGSGKFHSFSETMMPKCVEVPTTSQTFREKHRNQVQFIFSERYIFIFSTVHHI